MNLWVWWMIEMAESDVEEVEVVDPINEFVDDAMILPKDQLSIVVDVSDPETCVTLNSNFCLIIASVGFPSIGSSQLWGQEYQL
jgi:hypothetical protein